MTKDYSWRQQLAASVGGAESADVAPIFWEEIAPCFANSCLLDAEGATKTARQTRQIEPTKVSQQSLQNLCQIMTKSQKYTLIRAFSGLPAGTTSSRSTMQRTSSSLSRGASPAMIRRPSVGQACSPARVGVTSSASPVPLTRTVSQGSSLSGTAASPSLSRTSSHTSMSSLSSLSGSVGGYITRTTSLDNLTASVLSADEQALYAQLTTLAERRQHKTNIDVIVFTDCGKDKDDLMALMGLSVLHSLGLVNVLAVVVHMYPVNKRAALVRGLLDSLGLTKTRVLIGSNEYMPEPIMHEYYYEFEFDALPPASRQTEYHPMMQVLPGLLQKRWKLGRKIRLLSIGTVRDLLILISTETGKRLLQTTVDQIHIQGGIKWVLDGNGQEHLEPDPDANNNGNDFEAAKLFTPWLGKSGIPFVVYTKIATFNAPPPKDTFEHLPHDGNPLTKYLRHLHKEQGWTYYR